MEADHNSLAEYPINKLLILRVDSVVLIPEESFGSRKDQIYFLELINADKETRGTRIYRLSAITWQSATLSSLYQSTILGPTPPNNLNDSPYPISDEIVSSGHVLEIQILVMEIQVTILLKGCAKETKVGRYYRYASAFIS